MNQQMAPQNNFTCKNKGCFLGESEDKFTFYETEAVLTSSKIKTLLSISF